MGCLRLVAVSFFVIVSSQIQHTINDEATMQRLIDLGSDGITSDDVDPLIEVARRNGL